MTATCPRCRSEIRASEITPAQPAAAGQPPQEHVQRARCVCCGARLARVNADVGWELSEQQ